MALIIETALHANVSLFFPLQVTSVQLNLLALTDNDYNDGVLKLHVSLFSWGEAGSDQPQYDHMARIAVSRAAAQELRSDI